jgi:hypothetical protein
LAIGVHFVGSTFNVKQVGGVDVMSVLMRVFITASCWKISKIFLGQHGCVLAHHATSVPNLNKQILKSFIPFIVKGIQHISSEIPHNLIYNMPTSK